LSAAYAHYLYERICIRYPDLSKDIHLSIFFSWAP
jgi:hypothetical protein